MQDKKDWRVLEFHVPIKESVTAEGIFLIKGVAINETTTLNNVKYVAEELEKAAASFRNVPILLDHENKVRNIVGRTTENVMWSSANKRIEFEGSIMDKDIQEMIKDGRIGSVSIGARVHDLVEEEDGSRKAIGIEGLELSIVAVPGDIRATLTQALQESFSLKNKQGVLNEIKKEESDMAEEEKPAVESEEISVEKEESKEEAKEEPKEEPKQEEATEKVQNISVKVDTSEISEMRKQIDEMKVILLAKKEVKEEAEEAKDETKGEVSEEEVAEEKANDIVVEQTTAGKFALYRDYTKENSALKRLVR